MIRHLVLFKLNEGVERDDPRVVKGVEAFRSLDGQIPEIRFWELGWNVSDRPIAHDFAINSAFDDAGRAAPVRGASRPSGGCRAVARVRHVGDRRLRVLTPVIRGTGSPPSFRRGALSLRICI